MYRYLVASNVPILPVIWMVKTHNKPVYSVQVLHWPVSLFNCKYEMHYRCYLAFLSFKHPEPEANVLMSKMDMLHTVLILLANCYQCLQEGNRQIQTLCTKWKELKMFGIPDSPIGISPTMQMQWMQMFMYTTIQKLGNRISLIMERLVHFFVKKRVSYICLIWNVELCSLNFA